MTDPDYIGWIPNASQRLSFGLIGSSDFPERAVSGYAKPEGCRVFVSYQRRETIDIPIPFRWLRSLCAYLTKRAGRCWYVATACTPDCDQEDGSLEGRLYLLVRPSDWHPIRPSIRDIQSRLRQRGEAAPDELESKRLLSDADQILEDRSNHYVNFSLDRQGICRIKEGGTKLGDLSEERQEDLAVQLYFFLKDISHVHQHHHKNSDRIVELYRYKDDVSWRKATLYSLYRQALRAKRMPSSRVISSAKGILAYTDAFLGISQKQLSKEDYEALPSRDHSSMLQSIEATESIMNPDNSFTSKVKTAVLSGAAVLSLLFAVVGLGSFASDPKIEVGLTSDHVIRQVIEYLVKFPELVFLIWFLISIFWALSSGALVWHRWDWVQKLVALGALISRKNLAGAFMLAGSLMVVVPSILLVAMIVS